MEESIKNNELIDEEDILLGWQFSEFEKHQRNKLWYIIAGIILIALVIYAVFAANFLFAVILIIISAIIYLQEKRGPDNLLFAITPDGLFIGDKIHPYKSIKNFYLIYEPPEVKNLFIDFNSALKPRLTIPLLDQDPVTVRELLLEYLDEDIEKEYEPLSEIIGRFLKL